MLPPLPRRIGATSYGESWIRPCLGTSQKKCFIDSEHGQKDLYDRRKEVVFYVETTNISLTVRRNFKFRVGHIFHVT